MIDKKKPFQCYAFIKALKVASGYYDGDKSALYMLHCNKNSLWDKTDIERMIQELKAVECIQEKTEVTRAIETMQQIKEVIK